MSERVLVFVILAVAFAIVGIALFLSSRRNTERIRRFAGARNLKYEPRDDGNLEARVNGCVALDESGLARVFSQFRDLVWLAGAMLFRAAELLDLSPCGGPRVRITSALPSSSVRPMHPPASSW